jgi:protocatechuate 3,4-dioxygenase beta subunit
MKLTPGAAEGPFYPVDIPLDADADLVQVKGMSRPATGIVSHVTGKVVDANGRPIIGAKVEIWQCDAFGAYKHPRDRGDISEPEFQGYGFTRTTETGAYRFRTIRPTHYPGRTPHIHAKITAPGQPTLTTQFYVEGEAKNASDFLYRRVPEDRREMVTARFPASADESDSVIPEYTVVVG